MAIKLDPKGHYAYYKRSKSYENKENYIKAIADIRKALELDPGNNKYSKYVNILEDIQKEKE